jgi:tRNA modification GTPase
VDTHSTILACATPPGRAARGIVRISGPDAFDLVARLAELPSIERGVHRLRLQLEAGECACLVLLAPSPHSFTGEDTVEIQCPGNHLLLDRVIETLLRRASVRGIDARRAEPGEYSARAYLNRRLDLVQAEGVAATIAARSDAELRAAGMLREGKLGDHARTVADAIAGALALVEAGIDFTDEEDIVAITSRDLRDRLVAVRDQIDELLRRSVGFEQLEDIPWVVLAGAPNAGKSTLFNALLGRDRAVVSALAGTTRDVLVEPLSIDTAHGPAEVMLVDVAGREDAATTLQRDMQGSAATAARRAALILICVPAGEVRPDVREREIVVTTKTDLATHPPSFGVCVSASTGQGLDTLRDLIAARLAREAVSLDSDLMVLRQRHESALRAAYEALAEALLIVGPHVDARHLADSELIATALRAALDETAGLAGDVTPDDVLGRIFSTFCIGK